MGAEITTRERSTGMSGRVAGIVTAVGGALMAIGSLLGFASVEAFGFSQTVSGLDTNDGKLFLGFGIGLLVIGVVILLVASSIVRRVLGVIGVLASGFMLYAAIVDITGIDDEVPAQLAEQVTVSAGIGLYLVLIASVIALIGSGMALFARGEERAAAAPPPPPPSPDAPPRADDAPPPPPPPAYRGDTPPPPPPPPPPPDR